MCGHRPSLITCMCLIKHDPLHEAFGKILKSVSEGGRGLNHVGSARRNWSAYERMTQGAAAGAAQDDSGASRPRLPACCRRKALGWSAPASCELRGQSRVLACARSICSHAAQTLHNCDRHAHRPRDLRHDHRNRWCGLPAQPTGSARSAAAAALSQALCCHHLAAVFRYPHALVQAGGGSLNW